MEQPMEEQQQQEEGTISGEEGPWLSLESVQEALPPVDEYLEGENVPLGTERSVGERSLAELFPLALASATRSAHERAQLDAARRAEDRGEDGAVNAVLAAQREAARARRAREMLGRTHMLLELARRELCVSLEALRLRQERLASLCFVEEDPGTGTTAAAGVLPSTTPSPGPSIRDTAAAVQTPQQQGQQGQGQAAGASGDDARPTSRGLSEATLLTVLQKQKAYRTAAECLARAAKRGEALRATREHYRAQVAQVGERWLLSTASEPPHVQVVCSSHVRGTECLQCLAPNAAGDATTVCPSRARLAVRCIPAGTSAMCPHDVSRSCSEDDEGTTADDAVARQLRPACTVVGAAACTKAAQEAHDTAFAREVFDVLKDGAVHVRAVVRGADPLAGTPTPRPHTVHAVHALVEDDRTLRLSTVLPHHEGTNDRDGNDDGDRVADAPCVPCVVVALQDAGKEDEEGQEEDVDGLALRAVAEQEVLRAWDRAANVCAHDGLRQSDAGAVPSAAAAAGQMTTVARTRQYITQRQHSAVLEHMMHAHAHTHTVRAVTAALERVAQQAHHTVAFHIGPTHTTAHTHPVAVAPADFATDFAVWSARERIDGTVHGVDSVAVNGLPDVFFEPHMLEGYLLHRLVVS